jgi:hypothetical protein
MATDFAMYENIFPLKAPNDNTTTTVAATPFIDLATAIKCSILIQFGVVTSATPADALLINLECSTAASTTTGENIAFKYRYSGAVTANTWSAVTDATSTGISVASDAFDGLSYLIDIDPEVIVGVEDTKRYVRVIMTEEDAYSALNWSAVAFIKPRYHQTTMVSVTA